MDVSNDEESQPLLQESDSVVYSAEFVKSEADLVFDSMVHEAIKTTVGFNVKSTPCPWISPDRVRKGKEFFRRNYFVCVWSIFVSQLAQGPILRIENQNDGRFVMGRLILQWFDQDILKKVSFT